MTRPQEHDYISMTAYTRALEAYCDCLEAVQSRLVSLIDANEKLQAHLHKKLAELEKQEPCSKCHGLGYYDEGHENDDGSMSGGNYVECDKCKPTPIGWATKAQIANGAFLVGPDRGNECLGLIPLYTAPGAKP